jgi:hypothetical protein
MNSISNIETKYTTMPQTCTICTHPDRTAIDTALVGHASLAKLSQEYGVDYNALYRHSKNHVPKQLLKVYEKRELTENFNLMAKIDFLVTETEDIYAEARKGGKSMLALKSLDSLRAHYQLLINISAQLHQQKVLELELQKNNNTTEFENLAEQARERYSRLTTPELKEYLRLVNKMTKD